MSEFLHYERFNLGWIPSDDAVKGRADGLLRMDNLRLDSEGVLELCPGAQRISTLFNGFVHSCYSKMIDNVKHRFVGLSTGVVIRSTDGFQSVNDFVIPAGGDPARAHWESALGQIFITSGFVRKKFDGVSTRNLGIYTPQFVGLNYAPQPNLDVGNWGNWGRVAGQNFVNGATFAQVDNDPATNRGIIQNFTPFDATNLSGQSGGTDDDTFQIDVQIGDSEHLQSVKIVFLLNADPAANPTDYYFHEYLNDDNSPFIKGTDVWSRLTLRRGEFERAGNNDQLNWSTVTGIHITFLYDVSGMTSVISGLFWVGGTAGPLTGSYEYFQQNVYDSGVYVGKSPLSPAPAEKFVISNGATVIAPDEFDFNNPDGNINQVWYYRRGEGLERPYRIGVRYNTDPGGLAAPFTDTMTDSQALEIGITADLFLQSVQDITEEIFSMVGMYMDRMIYLGTRSIFLSDVLNPDAIDTRYTLVPSGDKTELNLWLTRISNSVLLCGTTKNIYEVTGTLASLPDGAVDALLRPLGESHPPICHNFALDSGTVFYMANDGWRLTNGGRSELVTYDLRLLYKGETRHGIAGVAIYPNELAVYPCAVYKGQLWTSNILLDGSRPLFIYDLVRRTWRLHYTNPICLFTEEDGTLIGGYGSPGDYYLRQLDTGVGIDGDPAAQNGQQVELRTVFVDGGRPRNRKDVFTYKLVADTGGVAVDIWVAKDNFPYVKVKNKAFSSYDLLYVDLANTVGIGFKYSIKITGSQLATFKIYEQFIEFDPRPEQLDFLRIPPSNLGTVSRKRLINYAFVIDTLGKDVTFTPVADGVVGTSSTVNLNRKGTHIHYFISETLATDISGTLQSVSQDDPFEFYGLNEQEIISEKLPVPVKYLVIPPNDYGTPNRKRHSSYKFQLLSRGKNVRFTPILDGVSLSPSTFNTATKTTCEHFFTTDTIGIDIGGILETLEDTPFEFYGAVIPQHLEVLPPRLREFRIPENNYGIAAKKRVRTMPMVINTNGSPVTFTPIVDQSIRSGQVSTFTTSSRQTVLHYFTDDEFGIDFSGELLGAQPFEFYGLEKPEDVEVLPVGKRFDQVGPLHLDRLGKVIGFRLRVIATGVSIPWNMLFEDTSQQSGTIVTVPNVADNYEVEWLAKTKVGKILRFELGPADVFHRYYVEFKVNFGGKGGDSHIKWLKVK